MRALTVFVALVATVAVGLLGGSSGVREARACSIVGFSASSVPETVERSAKVAVGRWEEAEERRAVFVVEEALKGVEVGERVVVDNRGTYTMVACSPYDEPFQGGYRFADGQRSVLMLEKEVDGMWQVSYLGLAAFEAPEDALEPLRDPAWPDITVSVEKIREAALAGTPGSARPELEIELGCEPPHMFDVRRLEDYAGLSSAVALVTVASQGEVATLTVDEVLSGRVDGSSITLNDHWITDYATKDCQPSVEEGRRFVVEGAQYAVFLVADEFGLAQYRPAAWGEAIVAVNAEYVTGGAPTLAGIRVATGRPAEGVVADEAAAVEQKAEGDNASGAALAEDGGDGRAVWVAAVVIGAVVIGAAAGLMVVRRRAVR